MTIRLLLLSLLSLAACDRSESFGDEAGEAVEAIRDGRPMDEVGEEAGEAARALTERRSKLNRELDKIERWFEARADELGDAEPTREFEDAVNDLGRRIDQAGQDVADATEDSVDDVEAELRQLRRDTKDLFDGDDR